MSNLKTEAYLPFNSNQDWTSDPDFAVIAIDENLVNLVLCGLNALKESRFDTIASSRHPVGWELVDRGNDYERFESEYTVIAPNVVISSRVQFVFDFKNTYEQGWCELSFEQLAGYMDKAWVESYGNVFVQLPDTDDDGDGKWLCLDASREDAFVVECDTLEECIKEAADWLDSMCDEVRAPRPNLEPLRDSEGQVRRIGIPVELEPSSQKRSCRPS
jgi:hypothetical protein